MNEICRTNLSKVFNLKRIIQSLNLPFPSRWEVVKPALKKRMVEARLSQNDDLAAHLSEVQCFLKRNCYRTCKCGSVIKANHLKCIMCHSSKGNISISESLEKEVKNELQKKIPLKDIKKKFNISHDVIKNITFGRCRRN